MVLLVMFVWWKDVIVEATYLGYHTNKVVRGLKIGMILFIASEIMFFFSFFWAFFHASLSPSIVGGSVWPPLGIVVLNPLKLPLLNTIILLSSGVSVTWAHYSLCQSKNFSPYVESSSVDHVLFYDVYDSILVENAYHMIFSCNILKGDTLWNNKEHQLVFSRLVYDQSSIDTQLALLVTLILAIEFTGCQAYEYYEALFYINDGVYGSTFYVATGFHGLHVMIGTIFLGVALGRLFKEHFTFNHHVGFELAIWYWHFVDVVWLVLYVFIYCWSGGYSSMNF
jgi:heme/copper-type cytochrome/quinol oxidase subunit 3